MVAVGAVVVVVVVGGIVGGVLLSGSRAVSESSTTTEVDFAQQGGVAPLGDGSSNTTATVSSEKPPLTPSTVAPTSSTTLTPTDTLGSASPDTSGRSPVMRLMPSGKVMLVGESVEVRAEIMKDSSGYRPTKFELQSEDPSVASADGSAIAAVGAGSTHVYVVTDVGTEYVSVSVYADAQTRDDAEPFEAFMPEAPIYTDGRVTIGSWGPPGNGEDTEVFVTGFLDNVADQDLALSVDQFRLVWPKQQGLEVPTHTGSGFDESMYEGELLGDSCVVTAGGEVGLNLSFVLPEAADWSTGWLVFEDAESMIAIPASDIPAT